MRKEIFETFKTFEKYEKLYESYLNEAKEEQETEEISDNDSEEDATEAETETDAEAVEEPPVADEGTQALANGLLTLITANPPHVSNIPFEKQTITPENLNVVIGYLRNSFNVNIEPIEEDKRQESAQLLVDALLTDPSESKNIPSNLIEVSPENADQIVQFFKQFLQITRATSDDDNSELNDALKGM